MEHKEIVEGNRLIARSLGMLEIEHGWVDQYDVLKGTTQVNQKLLFYNTWPWLMSAYQFLANKRSHTLSGFIDYVSDEHSGGDGMDNIDEFFDCLVREIKSKKLWNINKYLKVID